MFSMLENKATLCGPIHNYNGVTHGNRNYCIAEMLLLERANIYFIRESYS